MFYRKKIKELERKIEKLVDSNFELKSKIKKLEFINNKRESEFVLDENEKIYENKDVEITFPKHYPINRKYGKIIKVFICNESGNLAFYLDDDKEIKKYYFKDVCID